MKRPPTDMLAAALLYVEVFGWAVFPAPPGTKKSYKSAKFNNGRRWGATNKPRVIKRDFKRWPKANIGIPCGPEPDIWILDADSKRGHGKDGIAALRKLERKHGRLPKTLMTVTPSGGRHYYFRWPKGELVINSDSKIAPGVDVRGAGGMVLAPPSIKPGVGAYRWLNWGTPIADAPAWLLRLVVDKPRKQGDQTTANYFEQYGEPDVELLAAAVRVIPNDDVGWETWNTVGMALYRASGGSAAGLRIFHEFSERSTKYSAANTDAKWQAFKRSPPRQIGAGSIFFWANEADPLWRAVYEARRVAAYSFFQDVKK
jgi:putative DNA primase/helicase